VNQQGHETTRAPLERLRLDPLNPRLPHPSEAIPQEELIQFIDRTYDPIAIARSIAEHTYFESEPLIAIRDGNNLVVVEGNRRLVALKGLADADARRLLQNPEEWEHLAERASLPDDFPVIVAESRREVAPIIGFRHISGIEPWEPFAKSRFIASLVDEGLDFGDVADLVGESETDVRAAYRNYRIVVQAEDEFRLDTSNVKDDFGVFSRAMNSVALRNYIGAPPPRSVHRAEAPIPSDRRAEVERLFTWVFGDEEDQGRVIDESRDLPALARVVASEEARSVLEDAGDLEVANEALGGPRDRLIRRLNRAHRVLLAARQDIDEFREDQEVAELLSACEEAIGELQGNGQD